MAAYVPFHSSIHLSFLGVFLLAAAAILLLPLLSLGIGCFFFSGVLDSSVISVSSGI